MNRNTASKIETLKLKIKVGDRRFEAEGPVDVVTAHGNAFMKITLGANVETIAAEKPTLALDRIMRAEGTNVALKILPKHATDAVVALMFGYRTPQNNHIISGGDIVRALSASGRPTDRANHLLNMCGRYNYVKGIGKNRGRRYQLTDAGVERAETVARALINVLPKAESGST